MATRTNLHTVGPNSDGSFTVIDDYSDALYLEHAAAGKLDFKSFNGKHIEFVGHADPKRVGHRELISSAGTGHARGLGFLAYYDFYLKGTPRPPILGWAGDLRGEHVFIVDEQKSVQATTLKKVGPVKKPSGPPCPTCQNPMTLLLSSFKCDTCSPPGKIVRPKKFREPFYYAFWSRYAGEAAGLAVHDDPSITPEGFYGMADCVISYSTERSVDRKAGTVDVTVVKNRTWGNVRKVVTLKVSDLNGLDLHDPTQEIMNDLGHDIMVCFVQKGKFGT